MNVLFFYFLYIFFSGNPNREARTRRFKVRNEQGTFPVLAVNRNLEEELSGLRETEKLKRRSKGE